MSRSRHAVLVLAALLTVAACQDPMPTGPRATALREAARIVGEEQHMLVIGSGLGLRPGDIDADHVFYFRNAPTAARVIAGAEIGVADIAGVYWVRPNTVWWPQLDSLVREFVLPPNARDAHLSLEARAYGQDNILVYVNGNFVYELPHADGTQLATAEIDLQPGLNRLVFEVDAYPFLRAVSYKATITYTTLETTPPVITFSGAASYTVDQTLSITCTAADPESGIASETCSGASGPAHAAGVGSHTLTASATNGVGLTATASFTYTVSVTATSLSALVNRWVTHGGTANSLTKKLEHGQTGAFINEVQAQSGKKIPSDTAAILMQLARAL